MKANLGAKGVGVVGFVRFWEILPTQMFDENT